MGCVERNYATLLQAKQTISYTRGAEMIDEGNGEIAKRLKQGLCPKCLSQLIERVFGWHCAICGLDIKEEKKLEKSVNNT